jgi:hypothetical protein
MGDQEFTLYIYNKPNGPQIKARVIQIITKLCQSIIFIHTIIYIKSHRETKTKTFYKPLQSFLQTVRKNSNL